MTVDDMVDMHMRALSCPYCASMIPLDNGFHRLGDIAIECQAECDNTAAPDDQPDPPYPHRTHVCAGCNAGVDEDDLADGRVCHICIKS